MPQHSLREASCSCQLLVPLHFLLAANQHSQPALVLGPVRASLYTHTFQTVQVQHSATDDTAVQLQQAAQSYPPAKYYPCIPLPSPVLKKD